MVLESWWISIGLLVLIAIYFINSKKSNRRPPLLVLLLLLAVGTFLQYIGISYQSNSLWYINLTQALFTSIKMITADFRHEPILELMNEEPTYFLAVLIVQALTVLYSIYFFVSIISFKTVNMFRVHFGRLKEQFVVFGSTDNLSAFIKSIDEKTRLLVYVDERINKTEEELIDYYSSLNHNCKIALMFKDLSLNNFKNLAYYRRRDLRISFVSLYDQDEKNMFFIHAFNQLIKRNENNHYKHIYGYSLISNYEQATELKSVCDSKGYLSVFNKQDLISKKFIQEFSLTDLIPNSFIESNGKLKDEVYNYHLVGFGKLNQDLLKKLICNNQFLDTDINYYIYSKNTSDELEIFLKHLRIFHNEKINKLGKITSIEQFYNSKEYYPAPNSLGNIYYDSIDVNKLHFLQTLKSRITPKLDVNVIIFSLGNEILSAQIARDLTKYLSDEKLTENTHVFAKIGSSAILDDSDTSRLQVKPIGILEDTLTFKMIIDKVNERFAMAMHEEYISSPKGWAKKWDENPMIQKSNMYVAMHIKTKLHLSGLELSNQEPIYDWKSNYYRVYNPNKRKPFSESNNKTIQTFEKYYLNQNQPSLRMNLARIEKKRWNAFYLMNGWLPMRKSIFRDNLLNQEYSGNPSKNEYHEHVCITSFSGLVEVAKTMVELGETISNSDYLQYDFVLMDHLPKYIEAFNTLQNRKDKEKIYIVNRRKSD